MTLADRGGIFDTGTKEKHLEFSPVTGTKVHWTKL